MSHHILLADLFFFLWRFFSKLFCADFSSKSLWWTCFVQYLFGTGSIEICLVRISLQKNFGKRNVFEGILVIRSSNAFGRDSSSQSFGWECLFRDSVVQIFQIFFGSDFPPIFFGIFFKESLKTKNEPKNL